MSIPAANSRLVEQLRAEAVLDRPLAERLWIHVRGVLSGDLGMSQRQGWAVAGLIAERLPATLLLTGTAVLLTLVTGVALGAAAARSAGSWADSAIRDWTPPFRRSASLLAASCTGAARPGHATVSQGATGGRCHSMTAPASNLSHDMLAETESHSVIGSFA